MPSSPGDRAKGLQRALAANGIEDDIRTMPACQCLERVAPIRLGVVDDVVRAETNREFALFRRRSRRDNPRAQKFSELDGGDADAARGAQYQKDFTFAQISAFAQRIE